MKLLFLHPNFPGQFRNSCEIYAIYGHEVKFLCQTHFGRTIKGVERLCLKGSLSHENLENNTSGVNRAEQMAGQFRSAMSMLDKEGWVPDIVVSHSGWGCGMHVKEIWPETKLISYLEWWFNPLSELTTFDPSNRNLPINNGDFATLWKRNQSIALELTCADLIIAPTNWQRKQLPLSIAKNCKVIFDGVNKSVFKPNHRKYSPKPLLTYGTRGMEPIRCFSEFIKEIPTLIKAVPELRIEIAGQDRVNYGGKLPKEGSWGKWAKKWLSENEVASSVSWRGLLKGDEYVEWLQSSWVHVYLTQPYVASWSLAEAICCQCQLICSENSTTKEFEAYSPIKFVDHRQPGFLTEAVISAIMAKKQYPSSSLQKHVNLSKEYANQCWLSVLRQMIET